MLLSYTQLLDYDAARSRMKKLIEKPSDDPNKLPKVETLLHNCLHPIDYRLSLGPTGTR
jgi:hypothetical protein